MIAYRRDIDGLRSIAVLAVVLYHFGVAPFGGGYVGVDIFFVISGFLIGRSIIDDMRSGRFSLLDFYERRIRRLYPAFAVTFVISAAIFSMIMLPPDLRAFGRSLFAAILYVSNIAFYTQRGYFDPDAITKPLLHTWSLSVEEQFYVLFPLLVWVAWFLKRLGVLTMVVGGTILSFAAAETALPYDPSGVFFLLPYRAWELLLGVATSQLSGDAADRVHRLRLPVAIAGLALITVPVFVYGPDTAFPGLAALPPCAGTVMLIAAGGRGSTPIARLLSTRLPVFVGLISYSLYLWHWPIVVALNYLIAQPNALLRGAGVLLSIGCGWLSWRFIERPFRARNTISRRTLFISALGVSVLLSAVGLALWRSDGWPSRYQGKDAALAFAAGDFLQTGGVCVGRDNAAIPGLEYCRIGLTDRPPTFLVWGDSHARAWRDGIDLQARELGRSGLLVWAGGCPPLFDLSKQETAGTPGGDRACRIQNDQVRALLADDADIRSIIVIGRWSYYSEGSGTGADAYNRLRLLDRAEHPAPDIANQRRLLSDALSRTVDTLRADGRAVWLMQATPEIPEANARIAAIRILTGQESSASIAQRTGTVSRARVEQRQAFITSIFAELGRRSGVHLIATHNVFCNQQRCSAWRGGVPILFDNNHVTVTTSKSRRGLFRSAIEAAPR